MFNVSLTHLDDSSLLESFDRALARESTSIAIVLAHIAEVDARGLYRPAGYASMYLYCVHEKHLSEGAAYRRITAARAARRFPEIFRAVAEGRLHLSGIGAIASYLTDATVSDLLSAAEHKTKAEIERLVAERFPRPDLPTVIQALPSADATADSVNFSSQEENLPELAPAPTSETVALHSPTPRAIVTPVAPQRTAYQFTADSEFDEMLRQARSLVSHQVPSGDLVQVLKLVLEAGLPVLQKAKFAATEQPRPRGGSAKPDSRDIPADVKRAVWDRDGGKCTFVGSSGHRCNSDMFVEFDHVHEFARGGEATVANVRLLCRAHNQFMAEQTYGPEFMKARRHESRRAARAKRAARTRPDAGARKVI